MSCKTITDNKSQFSPRLWYLIPIGIGLLLVIGAAVAIPLLLNLILTLAAVFAGLAFTALALTALVGLGLTIGFGIKATLVNRSLYSEYLKSKSA